MADSARDRTPEQWATTRKDVGEADIWALWQGHPFPASGGLSKAKDIRFWQPGVDRWQIQIPGRHSPPDEILRSPSAFRFITVDLAASTRTSADWSVAAAWAVAGTGELLMLHLRRAQVDPSSHWDEVVAPLQSKWDCPIYIENS